MAAKNGHEIPILVHGSTLWDDQGAIIGNMAFATNLSEQKKSLTLAGEIQRTLLPQNSHQYQGLDIAGRTAACDEIGGDYFDFIQEQECSNKHFGAVVGDVTGHGVDAALLMTTVRAQLRMRASQCGGISQIVTEMNHQFGKKRFREIIRENAHLKAEEIIDAVYRELNAYALGLKQADDVTLVVIKLKDLPPGGEDWQI